MVQQQEASVMVDSEYKRRQLQCIATPGAQRRASLLGFNYEAHMHQFWTHLGTVSHVGSDQKSMDSNHSIPSVDL